MLSSSEGSDAHVHGRLQNICDGVQLIISKYPPFRQVGSCVLTAGLLIIKPFSKLQSTRDPCLAHTG